MKCDKKILINRLKRIEGQARGIQRMVDEEVECKEIISQLSALDAAVRNAAKVVLAQYLKKCLEEEQGEGKDFSLALKNMTDMLMKARI